MQYNGFDENSDTLIKGELDLHVYTSKTTTIEDEILYNILLDNYDGSYKILITFILGWFVVGLIIVSLWCFFDLIHIAITDDDCFLTDSEIEIKKQKQKDREEYYKRAQAEYEERMRELSGEE